MLYNRDFRWISRNKQTSKNTSRENVVMLSIKIVAVIQRSDRVWKKFLKVFDETNRLMTWLMVHTCYTYIHDSVFIQFDYMSQIGPKLIKGRQRRRSCTKIIMITHRLLNRFIEKYLADSSANSRLSFVCTIANLAAVRPDCF